MEEIYFHDIVVDNRSSNPKSDFPDNTFIQIFGCKSDGTPVFVEVKNFKTWFYLEPEEDEDPKELIKQFKDCFWFKNVTECKIVFRKRLVGFSDNELFPYIYLEFGGVVPLYCARKKLKEDFKITKIYEDKVDPILKFLHSTRLKTCSYFGIKNFSDKNGKENGKTHCEKEFYVSIENIFPIEDKMPPPMKICAYDIESSGLNPRTESVFQVSMCFSKLGDKVDSDLHASEACKDGVVICVGETESIDDTPILSVENEKDLLEKFRDKLIENNVMIMVGYNNSQFDCQFLYKRATETYSFDDYRKLGFKRDELLELKNTVLASSALGRTELAKVNIPGRVEIDLLMVLRRTYKLKSYKLNSVSEHFFGGSKDDVTYTDILEAYNTKDPHKLGVIAKYCFQDSWLCIRLLDKIKEVYNSIEMAKLCSVPFLWIMSRGQQIKCFSLILSEIYGEYVCNYIAPTESKTEDEGFQGATVINAKTGFYPDDPILTLDFASLYPSIMRWKQLCYSTYVTEDKYMNIENVVYETYETKKNHFDTFAYRKGQKSILCLLEDELIDARKATKKLMKTEKDPFKYSLLDSKQLSQKICCNSLYGFTGTTTGMLPLKAIAAAVTCTGRKMIDQSSELAEKMGATTIYGDTDSIMVTYPTPKEIMDQGELAMMKFLFNKGEEMSAEITKLFGHPVLMEFENIYTRYLLVSKKRYAALSWLVPEGPPKMSSKGLVTVRRDNAPIVRSTATEVLRLLLEEKKNEDDIIKYIKSVLDDLEKGKIPVKELSITKELTRWEYKNPVPHSILATNMIERAKKQRFYREIVKPIYEETVEFDEKNLRKFASKINSLYKMIPKEGEEELSMEEFMIRLRDGILSQLYPDNVMIKECEALCRKFNKESVLIEFNVKNSFEIAEFYSDYSTFDIIDWESPRLGDRISYVVTEGKGEINNRVEHPEYVDKMPNIKTDTHYYITRQLKNPITDFLNLFITDKSKLEFFKEYERRALNKSRGVREISSFFSPVTKRSKH